MFYKICCFLTLVTFISISSAQEEVTTSESGETKRPVNIILQKGATSIKNPLDLRDPFKRTRRRLRKRKKNYGGYLTEGKYSNLPSITTYPLNQIRIVGVLLGKNRRAIAKVALSQDGQMGPDSYMIKEGMKIGENGAEVKAIVPGGIVLVEKIRNVYDQDEYIETIIPVSVESN